MVLDSLKGTFSESLYTQKEFQCEPPFLGPGGQVGGQKQLSIKNCSEKAEKWLTNMILQQKIDFTDGFSQFLFFDPFGGSPGSTGGKKGLKVPGF